MDLDNRRYCPSVLPHLLRNIVVYMLLLKILIILMKTHLITQSVNAFLSTLFFYFTIFGSYETALAQLNTTWSLVYSTDIFIYGRS